MSALASSGRDVLSDILDALRPEPGLPGLFGDPPRVHDSVPDDPVYPYLTFGDLRSEDRSAEGVTRAVHQVSLHVWSQYSGRAETLDLLAAVQARIESALPHTVVPLLSDVFGAVSGGRRLPFTRHGLLRLSIITETET